MSDDVVEQVRDAFGRAAAGWERWGDLIGQRDDAARYVEAANVEPGHRLLEIGAGTGDQTLVLAQRVGPNGHVLATDLTEEMLTVARRRARAAGLDNITFGTADASKLDLGEGGFDAAVSGLTWMFLPDPVRSASRVCDLLTPGGRFAVSVWGPTDRVPMVSIAMGAALRELGIDPPIRNGRAAPDLSESDVFRSVLVDAGFVDVSVQPFTFTLTWESPEQYADWVRDVFVALSDIITEHGPDRSDDVYAAVTDAARDHIAVDGSLTFENIALMGAGERPA